jgi:hypothetical protein
MPSAFSVTTFLDLTKQGDPDTRATPAPMLAAGPEHLVQVTNSRILWANKDGSSQSDTNFREIFPEITNLANPGLELLSGDPQVIYDDLSDRFVVITQETRGHQTPDTSQDDLSRIHIAVSKTNDPNDGWIVSAINLETDATKTGHFADIPSVGIDKSSIYISANYLSFEDFGTPDTFDGRGLWVVDKGLDAGGFYTGGEASITWLGTPSGLEAKRAEDYSELHDRILWFGAATGGPQASIDLVYRDITSPDGFASVSISEQQGFDVKFGNGEPRIFQPNSDNHLWIPGGPIDDFSIFESSLYFATAYSDRQNDIAQQSIYWGEIDVSDLDNPTMLRSGKIDGENISPNTSVFLPSVAVNKNGVVGISFAASGPDTYFGSYFISAQSADFDGSVLQIKAGSGTVENYIGHFGDSSSLVTDPKDGEAFWASNTWVNSDGGWHTFGAELSAQDGNGYSADEGINSMITMLENVSGGPLVDAMFGTNEVLQVPVAERETIVGRTIGKWGGELGTGATISYSFFDPTSFFPSDYPPQYINEIGVIPEAMKQAHREAFAAWASVADVRFVEVAETELTVGDIRIGISRCGSCAALFKLSGNGIRPACRGYLLFFGI